MPVDRVVVVGASAGGVAALEKLVGGLPADFPAAMLVALHLPAGYKSLLADILSRAGPLPAADAADGEPLQPGRIYVAVPDAHLMLDGRVLRVTSGPRENGSRPSVDVLFRSAAYAWGSRAIGVVLSGSLDDGASGLWVIRRIGGLGIVQDPADAAYASMPFEALRRADPNYTIAASGIGPLLGRVVNEPSPSEPAHAAELRQDLEAELGLSAHSSAWKTDIMKRRPSRYTCPDCHGVMFHIPEGAHRRFRCHTGHGYTVRALLPKLVESSEDRLWDAVRAIQEAITLCREAAKDLENAGQPETAQEMLSRAAEAGDKLDLLRQMSLQGAGARALNRDG